MGDVIRHARHGLIAKKPCHLHGAFNRQCKVEFLSPWVAHTQPPHRPSRQSEIVDVGSPTLRIELSV
jgi:hypothetical protein